MDQIQMIPIEQINIVNPRVRNQKIYTEIVNSINKVGLKRPITVTQNISSESSKKYNLICGQGRLEAFIKFGQTHIPAIIKSVSEEEVLIMSLVENLARSQHKSLDLLNGIKILREKRYNAQAIASKIGMSFSHTNMIIQLLDKGEERLLDAVEKGNMPISVAISIANAEGEEQKILQEAYEKNELRGSKLRLAKQLLQSRQHNGKELVESSNANKKKKKNTISSVQEMVRLYQEEVDRKKILTRKANIASSRIAFITEALKRLLSESAFVGLLEEEKLTSIPDPIAELLKRKA